LPGNRQRNHFQNQEISCQALRLHGLERLANSNGGVSVTQMRLSQKLLDNDPKSVLGRPSAVVACSTRKPYFAACGVTTAQYEFLEDPKTQGRSAVAHRGSSRS
jgi:hypothetical protein